MMNTKELLLKLISFDTQNSDSDKKLNGDTRKLANFVKEILKNTGAQIEIQEYELNEIGKRANLIVKLPNPNNLPVVLLQGHMDTVPIGKFNYAPLGEEKDGIIYGRGAVDMKGSIAAIINSFLELSKQEQNLKYYPMILLTADEEANSFAGIKKFLEHNKEKIAFAINAEPTNFKVINRFKGAVYDKFEITGLSGHGSRPHEGINAIYCALPVLNKLRDFVDFVNTVENEEFESEDPKTKKSTMNIGRICGGDKVNKIPSSCTIEFEFRPVKPVEFYHSEFKKQILDKLPEDIKYTFKTIFAFDPIIAKKEGEFFEELDASLKRNTGEVNYGVASGFCEAVFMNRHGIPSVEFGAGNGKYAHTENEQIRISDVIKLKDILVDFYKKS